MMTRCALILLCCVCAGCGPTEKKAHEKPFEKNEAGKQAKEAISTFAEGREISATIAIAQGDSFMFSKSKGMADASEGRPCSLETNYPIGSITKHFIAVAILKLLWEKYPSPGAFDAALSKPLAHYLPPSDEVWNGSPPAWLKDVTVHQMLCHTAGIPDYVAGGGTDADGFAFCRQENSLSAREIASLFKGKALEFSPGTAWSYSSSGYFLLGEIVKRLSSKPLSTYFQEAFFKPLGMTHSFLPEDRTNPQLLPSYPLLARGYVWGYPEPKKPKELSRYWNHSQYAAAGGVISSAPDLIRWNQALFQGEILPPYPLKRMLTPWAGEDMKNPTYAYGLFVETSPWGTVYSHKGGMPGYVSLLAYWSSKKLSLVSLYNLMEDTKTPMARKIDAFAQDAEKKLAKITNAAQREELKKALWEEKFPGFFEMSEKYKEFDWRNFFPTPSSSPSSSQ